MLSVNVPKKGAQTKSNQDVYHMGKGYRAPGNLTLIDRDCSTFYFLNTTKKALANKIAILVFAIQTPQHLTYVIRQRL